MIDLNKAKLHLRVDHNIEDDYITQLINVSAAWVANYLGNDLPEQNNENLGIVEAAQLLLIADLYENRAMTIQTAQKNPVFDLLLDPLRTKAVL